MMNSEFNILTDSKITECLITFRFMQKATEELLNAKERAESIGGGKVDVTMLGAKGKEVFIRVSAKNRKPIPEDIQKDLIEKTRFRKAGEWNKGLIVIDYAMEIYGL